MKARVDIGAKDDGPHGVLVRGVLLDPEAFHSSPFLRIPETVENIIFAASKVDGVDLPILDSPAQLGEPCGLDLGREPLQTLHKSASTAVSGSRPALPELLRVERAGAVEVVDSAGCSGPSAEVSHECRNDQVRRVRSVRVGQCGLRGAGQRGGEATGRDGEECRQRAQRDERPRTAEDRRWADGHECVTLRRHARWPARSSKTNPPGGAG
jgi:hypothetical protein